MTTEMRDHPFETVRPFVDLAELSRKAMLRTLTMQDVVDLIEEDRRLRVELRRINEHASITRAYS